MATKNLDAYKLGVVLDAAGAAKGIAALADADKKAAKLDGTLSKLAKGIKFGLADKFKSELDEVHRLAGSSRASAVGEQLGGMIGGGIKDGLMSVLSAANVGKLIGTAIAPGVGTVVGSMIGGAVDTAIEKAAGPVKRLIQQGLDLNEVLERATVHFDDVLGSRERAIRHLADLNDIEGKSGIDMRELIAASQRLEEFNDDISLTTVELKAAAAQAVVFGSGVEGFHSVANALGLIAEKGELTSRTLLKLEKQGVHSTKYLSEALGVSEAKVKQLIAQNRLRGDVAARIIAEGIVAHKGAQSENVINSTLYGQRMLFENQVEELAGQGTRNASGAIRDSYRLGNAILTSPQAQQTVEFIDRAAGSLINLTKAAVGTGYNVTAGIVKGMLDTTDLGAGVSNFVTKFTDTLKSPLGFDINSPSKKMIPVGEDAAEGVVVGFESYMQGEGRRRLSGAVRGASEDLREAMERLSKEHGGDLRKYLDGLAQDPRFKAWFETIRQVEGGRPNVMAGGRTVNSGRRHPGQVVPRGQWFVGPKGPSSAAGNWQTTLTNWRVIAPFLGLDNFSDVDQQMMAALVLFAAGGGDKALLSGDLQGALKASAPWAATPRSHLPGRKPLNSSGFLGRYSSILQGGVPTGGRANAVPVVVVGNEGGADITSGDTYIKRDEYSPEFGDVVSVARSKEEWAALDRQKAQIRGIFDSVAQANTELKSALDKSQIQGIFDSVKEADNQLLVASYGLQRQMDAAAESTRGYSKTQEEYRKAAIVGMDMMSQAAGALSQIAGLLPSGGGTVGKKRGFFSKMLGFAAPFLNFIPGVGPILSQLANIGSNALAGNWGGVVTGVAGGLAPGGVFRRSSSSNGPAVGDVSVGQGNVGTTVNTSPPQRAAGGPVMRGRAYRLNEFRDEVVEFPEDGYVWPSVGSYERGRSGRGRGHARPGSFGAMIERLIEAAQRQTAAAEGLHEKISSMPADHVVAAGARGAARQIFDAHRSHVERDPSAVEWMNRRVA